MVKLTITAKNTAITVQDPRAVTQHNYERSVINVLPGKTASVSMQWQQLERLASQLSKLAEMGFCTFEINATGENAFADQPDLPGAPEITSVVNDIVSETTGRKVIGENLLAGQVQASATLVSAGTGETPGKVVVRDLSPGIAGNSRYSIEVVNTGTDGLGVTYNATTKVITVNLSATTPTSTCADVVTAINALEALAGLVRAEATGTDTDPVPVQAVQAFAGGKGFDGISLSLCGDACVITDIAVRRIGGVSGFDQVTLTFTTPVVADTKTGVLRLRTESQVTEVAVPIVVL
jgi:hypothetical protein